MRPNARAHRLESTTIFRGNRCGRKRRQRRGAVAVLAAIMLVVLFGFMAFAIDVGYIANMRTDIQASVDSAALAGAGALGYSDQQAIAAARHYATVNDVTGKTIDRSDLTVELGRWDKAGRVFQNGATPFTAVRVVGQSQNRGLFFGRVLGTSQANARAEAVAVMQPRDIMLVLDFSGSMRGAKIDALRDAVDVFVSALQTTAADDRVGFSWYNDNGALAQPMTFNLNSIRSAVHTRQAGGWTNIGEGMEIGRNELVPNARPGTMRMMVLMTDGLANRPFHRDPRQYVRNEAALAVAEGFPIVTISFGGGADQRLMEHVANVTDGVHFHVAGTSPAQREELKQVFLKVAARRPLQLVD